MNGLLLIPIDRLLFFCFYLSFSSFISTSINLFLEFVIVLCTLKVLTSSMLLMIKTRGPVKNAYIEHFPEIVMQNFVGFFPPTYINAII